MLLLDKPSGPSSNAVLQRLKWIYRADKAGHTGSLDPLASGLLPICFGEGTKLSTWMLAGDKGYRVRAQLGETRVGGDATGEVIAQCTVPMLDAPALEAILERFRGAIEQTPPMHSALKHQGQALYKLARQGIEIERQARAVQIKRLQLLEAGAGSLDLLVDCSKGTYIRTLVEDIGSAIGCGAHVAQLRRCWAAPFTDPQMHGMEAIESLNRDDEALDALLLPLEAMVADLPSIRLDGQDLQRFSHGNALTLDSVPIAEAIRVLDQDQRLLGIGSSLDGERLNAVRLLRRRD